MLLKTPVEVYWILTDRCNLRCNFCLSESDSAPRKHELTAAQRERVLHDLIQAEVLKVYLTGGEPLLIPETVDYVRLLSTHNVFTVLTTNGVLLDRQSIRRLDDCGLNRIQVSVHGSTPAMNDGIMGGPAFEAIMRTLEAISESGLDLHIKITATRENVHDLPRLVERLGAFGASLINIWEITPMGRGFHNREALQPPRSALETAREHVAEFNTRGMEVSFMSHTLQAAEYGRPSTCTVGNANATTCLIMADGNMTPCTPAHIWGLSNNVLEHGVQGAWHRLPRYARFIRPEKLRGGCQSCNLLEECRGGCRAEAYLFTNDVWGEDSPCIRLA